jgi:hypothetical protein
MGGVERQADADEPGAVSPADELVLDDGADASLAIVQKAKVRALDLADLLEQREDEKKAARKQKLMDEKKREAIGRCRGGYASSLQGQGLEDVASVYKEKGPKDGGCGRVGSGMHQMQIPCQRLQPMQRPEV